MSESQVSAPPAAPAGGPGAMLAAARRQQGLHIAALAAQLKVSPARLEALEAERWSALPDATHARALATSVCRLLGIDARPVLDAMPRGPGAALERVSAGLNQPVRDGAALLGLSPGLRWSLLAALLLLGLAAAVVFWPRGAAMPAWFGSGSGTPPQAVEAAVEAVVDPLPMASEPSPGLPAAPAVVASASIAPAPAVLPALASAPTAVPAVAPVPAAAASLEIRADRGASWVSVVDAQGSSLAARLLVAGEVLTLNPQAPVRVTLGNAPAVSLQWRGQAQPLQGFETVRVAKLELK